MTPSGRMRADIGVKNGKISAIGDLSSAPAKEIKDCMGLHILPGVIDSQVHFREPGNEHKENLESGTLGAILGGVTGIFEMPNTNPLTTTVEAIQDKLSRAENRAWCHYAFYVGGTDTNAENLPELEKTRGCCGVKIFMGSSTGDLLSAEDSEIEKILSQGYRRVAVHAEDEERLNQRFALVEGGADVRQHPVWRDVQTALKATKRVLNLAQKTGRRIHVLHITTAEEMTLLADYKNFATVEVTPQHLTLCAPQCYEDLGAYAQMNPPIREQKHQDALWGGIQSGVVDVLGSDHAPHTHAEKAAAYPNSPSGMTGVQTLVPIMLDHVHHNRLTLERFVDLVCHGPQRIFGIVGKGRLCVGYDADFTIVDLKEHREISNDWIKSKSGWTPYAGKKVTGWPKMTILMGKIAMENDVVLLPAQGKMIRFQEENS